MKWFLGLLASSGILGGMVGVVAFYVESASGSAATDAVKVHDAYIYAHPQIKAQLESEHILLRKEIGDSLDKKFSEQNERIDAQTQIILEALR